MRLTSVRIAGIVLLASLVLGTSPPRDLEDAEVLLEKHRYQEALGVYERVLQETRDSETRETAFLRICECLVRLDRVGEALERILDREEPESPPQLARFLIVRTKALRNFSTAYSRILRSDVIEEEEKEIYRLTPGELEEMIDETYRELWGLRRQLVKMKTIEESVVFDRESVAPGLFPTLFDFVITDWADFLLADRRQSARESETKVDAGLLLVDDFDRPVDLSDPPALLAAELLEEASRYHPDGRVQAGELRKILRLRLPSNYPGYFDFSSLASDDSVPNANTLGVYDERSKDILLSWMETMTTAEAAAEAGYQAALPLFGMDRPAEALEICKEIMEHFSSDTRGGACAEALRARIEKRTLGLSARTVMPPGTGALTVTSKNVREVYFRAYDIDPHRLRQEYEKYRARFSRRGLEEISDWSMILDAGWLALEWGAAWLSDFVSHMEPYREWRASTGYRGDYRQVKDVMDPPPLVPGIYLILGSDDDDFGLHTSLLSAGFLNVTRLMLVGTVGVTGATRDAYFDFLETGGYGPADDTIFRIYSFDAGSGQIARDVNVSAFVYSRGRERPFEVPLKEFKTDSRGVLAVPTRPGSKASEALYLGINPLARADNSFAYWPGSLWIHHKARNPLSIQVEMDRPVYQPGDEVRLKAIVVKRSRHGFETWGEGNTVEFEVRDANYKEFHRETVEIGRFGSASTGFVIPHGRLLGKYTIIVTYDGERFDAEARRRFSVEEYKRPEFEITLEPAREAWKYHEPVEIKGKAAYYFGGPVPDAPITYRIKKQRYVPFWFGDWYLSMHGGEGGEIAQGEVTTQPDGIFSIPFVPKPPPERYPGWIPSISRYSVEVEGRDAGGRTIEAGRTYRAGERSIYLVLKPARGFFSEADTVTVTSGLFTVDDVPQAGRGEYEVFTLGEVPEDSTEKKSPPRPSWRPCVMPPLEVQLRDAPHLELVAHGTVEHGEDGAGLTRFGPLRPGAYRVIETTADAWGDSVSQECIVVVTGDPDSAVMLDAYSVTLFDKEVYEVGDVARCLLGSSRGSGFYHVEIWSGEYLIDRIVTDGAHEVREVEIPVTEALKGAFTLRWFGVRDLEVQCGEAIAAVPWREKKLEITFDPFDPEMAPGESYTWGVNVADWEGEPVEGEVLALMYDRSLEYYVEGYSGWLDRLYEAETTRLDLRKSVLNHTSVRFDAKAPRYDCPDRSGPPKLRIHGRWYGSYYLGAEVDASIGLRRSVETISEAVSAYAGLVVDSDVIHVRGGREGEVEPYVDGVAGAAAFDYEELAAGIKTRGEFADAAFFEPHLVTADDGRAEFTFTVPEQLTAWKVKAFAHTRDVKQGSLVSEAVTSKDLIVRVDLPRFFREGDEGTITAVVHNESEGTLTGEVFIDVTEGGENINDRLGLTARKQRFSIEPHDLVAFDWRVGIPTGIGTYDVRVAAVSEGLSDAEEREVPILPSRQRLIESRFAVLSGNDAKTLEFRPGDDPTRENELMVLQVEPQLALSILNTIPFLTEYPYACVEQILNRYVPLSIVNEIYDDYPEIRKAVDNVPKRETIVPPWEQDDPRRLMTLMETPWVWQSEGRPASRRLTDLLNPDLVSVQKDVNLRRLREAQLPDGGFPWWPGGEADAYITLYVLAGFAEAKKYGVDVPNDVIDRALGYLNRSILKDKHRWEDRVQLIAYACYVASAFSPGDAPEAATTHGLVREWLNLLDDVIGELRPLPKAYLAYAHYRLGNETRAQQILDMALDGAREDPIAGVYWTPEKYSWVWYSDTVEKHAFFLKALQDMRPDDERLPGLVKWLLFNRKGNVWKSTKASAAAVYALLDYMRQRGALSADEVFEVDWGAEVYSAVVEADAWLDKPLRWEEKGFDIGEDELSATVEKEGPGTAFTSLTWIYSTDRLPEASGEGLLELERRFYRRVREGDEYHLKPIASGGEVAVGDQIEVHLKINARSRFEYMHLKDLKASGFEAERLLSGWRYDPLGFYEEPRHSLTNFFLSRIPHGEYVLRYRLKPTKPGTYRIGAATLQSMYAPEMTAHSAGFVITVIP